MRPRKTLLTRGFPPRPCAVFPAPSIKFQRGGGRVGLPCTSYSAAIYRARGVLFARRTSGGSGSGCADSSLWCVLRMTPSARPDLGVAVFTSLSPPGRRTRTTSRCRHISMSLVGLCYHSGSTKQNQNCSNWRVTYFFFWDGYISPSLYKLYTECLCIPPPT